MIRMQRRAEIRRRRSRVTSSSNNGEHNGSWHDTGKKREAIREFSELQRHDLEPSPMSRTEVETAWRMNGKHAVLFSTAIILPTSACRTRAESAEKFTARA